MSTRLRSLLIALAGWQIACLAMMYIYALVIRQLVVAAYTACFGDVQASYWWFSWLAPFIGFVVTTAPASFLTLRLFNGLSHRTASGKQMAVTFLGWELTVVAVLMWSYEVGFPYMVNQLGWALFGPPEDLYSFRNLVLHRIIAWLVCTAPVAWIALWCHSKLCRSDSAGHGPQNGGA